MGGSLRRYEWDYLSRLLMQGIPVQEALAMLRNDLDVHGRIEQGEQIEDILIDGQKGSFFLHLRFFLSITSFGGAIRAALDLELFEKSIKQKLIKQTSYPIMIFLFAFLTLYFFTSFVIPELMQSFSMQNEDSFLMAAVQLLQGLAMLVVVMVFLTLIFTLLLQRRPSLKFYVFQHLPLTQLPEQMVSYRLCGYLMQFIHQGISTKHAIGFLCQLPQDTVISHCARLLQLQLEEGMDMTEALSRTFWITPTMVQSWRIGLHTQDMETALQHYMERQEEQWNRKIKLISGSIQACAYGFVALMVVLVYQIMLVPLQLLETM